MADSLTPPPGFEWTDWLGTALQNGWVVAALAIGVAYYFLRQWQTTQEKLITALEQQNKLAERVTLVMERLERKAEGVRRS